MLSQLTTESNRTRSIYSTNQEKVYTKKCLNQAFTSYRTDCNTVASENSFTGKPQERQLMHISCSNKFNEEEALQFQSMSDIKYLSSHSQKKSMPKLSHNPTSSDFFKEIESQQTKMSSYKRLRHTKQDSYFSFSNSMINRYTFDKREMPESEIKRSLSNTRIFGQVQAPKIKRYSYKNLTQCVKFFNGVNNYGLYHAFFKTNKLPSDLSLLIELSLKESAIYRNMPVLQDLSKSLYEDFIHNMTLFVNSTVTNGFTLKKSRNNSGLPRIPIPKFMKLSNLNSLDKGKLLNLKREKVQERRAKYCKEPHYERISIRELYEVIKLIIRIQRAWSRCFKRNKSSIMIQKHLRGHYIRKHISNLQYYMSQIRSISTKVTRRFVKKHFIYLINAKFYHNSVKAKTKLEAMIKVLRLNIQYSIFKMLCFYAMRQRKLLRLFVKNHTNECQNSLHKVYAGLLDRSIKLHSCKQLEQSTKLIFKRAVLSQLKTAKNRKLTLLKYRILSKEFTTLLKYLMLFKSQKNEIIRKKTLEVVLKRLIISKSQKEMRNGFAEFARSIFKVKHSKIEFTKKFEELRQSLNTIFNICSKIVKKNMHPFFTLLTAKMATQEKKLKSVVSNLIELEAYKSLTQVESLVDNMYSIHNLIVSHLIISY